LAACICSVIAVAIVIERLWKLRSVRKKDAGFWNELLATLEKNQISDAETFCERHQASTPIARIASAGLYNFGQPFSELQAGIQMAAESEVFFLEKNLGTLSTIAAISPLIGFLGTVTGMIRAFMKIESLGGNVNAGVLAGGIWEALITTVVGLAVGILATIFYNYIFGKVELTVFEMEQKTNQLLDLLKKRGKPIHEAQIEP